MFLCIKQIIIFNKEPIPFSICNQWGQMFKGNRYQIETDMEGRWTGTEIN